MGSSSVFGAGIRIHSKKLIKSLYFFGNYKNKELKKTKFNNKINLTVTVTTTHIFGSGGFIASLPSFRVFSINDL
jgi:hypothetical protein